MQAIDTNVIVRYLVADDPGQYEIAANVIEGGPVFVPLTVLLETEWVLRDVYEIANQDVVRQLLAFSQLPGVTLEGGDRAQRAFSWAETGMDFSTRLGTELSTARALLSGKTKITRDIAQSLATAFGDDDSEYWINLEAAFERTRFEALPARSASL